MTQKHKHKWPGKIECVCKICGASFHRWPAEIGENTTCSQRCYHETKKRDYSIRFWEKVNKDGPLPEHCSNLGQCWVWTAATLHWGYGAFPVKINGKNERATHRVSWVIHHGTIPDNMRVLHKCDNPPCVRPDHLFLGTLKENTQDMLKKKRHLVKLSDEKQQEMRNLFATENATYAELGRRFGVCKATTWKVLAGKYSPGAR